MWCSEKYVSASVRGGTQLLARLRAARTASTMDGMVTEPRQGGSEDGADDGIIVVRAAAWSKPANM